MRTRGGSEGASSGRLYGSLTITRTDGGQGIADRDTSKVTARLRVPNRAQSGNSEEALRVEPRELGKRDGGGRWRETQSRRPYRFELTLNLACSLTSRRNDSTLR